MKKLTLLLCLLSTTIVLMAQIRKGPYLIYPDDETQMKVVYQFYGTEVCKIEWGTTTAYGNYAYSYENSSASNQHMHYHTISGLTPNTKYFYKVTTASGSGQSYTGSFMTAPHGSKPHFYAYAYGDTRTYPADQDMVCEQILKEIDKNQLSQTFLLHAGDWVDNGSLESQWDDEFYNRGYSNNIELQSKIPIMGVRGNHERYGNLFYKYLPFNYASSSNSYYSFDYGPLHVSVLDQYAGNLDVGQTQYNWLEDDLANSDKKWKIILVHAPAYGDGFHDNEPEMNLIRDKIVPLCNTYGVKLIFGGHNHYYAHHYNNNVHHLTLGGGGAPIRSPHGTSNYLIISEGTLHFAALEIKGNELIVDVIREDGSTIEKFSICEDYDHTDLTFTSNSDMEQTDDRDGIYYASNSIVAGGNVTIAAGSDVAFVAGERISLTQGFSAYKGSSFHAVLSQCDDSQFKNANYKYKDEFNGDNNAFGTAPQQARDIGIFPNPTDSYFTFEFSGNIHDIKQIVVFDLIGNIIESRIPTSNSEEFDLTGESPGMYFLKVVYHQYESELIKISLE